MSRCRSCQAHVLWVETEATETKPGKRMPLDAEPNGRAKQVEGGNIMFTGSANGDGVAIVKYVGKNQGLHVSHFATCPNAKQHRKGR